MKLFEIFEKALPFTLAQQSDKRYRYDFSHGDHNFSVDIKYDDDPGIWIFGFRGGLDDRKGIQATGQNNPWAILSTVIAIGKDFLERKSDEDIMIRFTAENKKRLKIYDKMLQEIVKTYPVKIVHRSDRSITGRVYAR